MYHILYQIFKIILSIFLKKYKEKISNLSISNCQSLNITFKIQAGYYIELLISETTKLLGSIENQTTKDKNGKNIPHLEIKEVVLINCNIVSNDYR